MWTPDPRYWIPDPTLVDSGFQKVCFGDFSFLDLDSGFQRVGFGIPQVNVFRIPDSTEQTFPGFRNPEYLTEGD